MSLVGTQQKNLAALLKTFSALQKKARLTLLEPDPKSESRTMRRPNFSIISRIKAYRSSPDVYDPPTPEQTYTCLLIADELIQILEKESHLLESSDLLKEMVSIYNYSIKEHSSS